MKSNQFILQLYSIQKITQQQMSSYIMTPNIQMMAYFNLPNQFIQIRPIIPEYSYTCSPTLYYCSNSQNGFFGNDCMFYQPENQFRSSSVETNLIPYSNLSNYQNQIIRFESDIKNNDWSTIQKEASKQFQKKQENNYIEGQLKEYNTQQKQKMIIKHKINKLKSKQQDKQYLPEKQKKNQQSNKFPENQNRNIIPNSINQILSFIQKKNKSGAIVEKLFQKYPHDPEFTIKRFYLYQSLLKNKIGHYTNQKSLKHVTQLYEPKCQIWQESEQRYYNKICRVLIQHFLYQDSIFIILTSKRMKSTKKLQHLRVKRQITKSILKILSDN